MSLEEAKKNYESEKIFPIRNGRCFLVNMFGKYKPNMSFIIPVEHYVDRDNEPVSFLKYEEADKTLVDALAIDFNGNGSPEVLFGDFWRSKKGGACFAPKSPKQAQHVLVRVNWGGAFSKCRGQYEKEDGGGLSYLAQYFRRAKSNGGGQGYDYYVFPLDAIGRKTQAAIREERAAARETCLLNEAEARQARTEAEKDAALHADERWARIEAVIKAAKLKGIYIPSLNCIERDGIYVKGYGKKRILTEEYVSEVENTLAVIKKKKENREERIAFFTEAVAPWLESLGFTAEIRTLFGGSTEATVFTSSGNRAFGDSFELKPGDMARLLERAAHSKWVDIRRGANLPWHDEAWKEYEERTRSNWPVWPFED